MDALYYISILSGIFCSLASSYLLFFISKNTKKIPNRLLAFILIGSGGLYALHLGFFSGYFREQMLLGKLADTIYILLALTSLLYIKMLLSRQRSFRRQDGWFLIPGAIGLLVTDSPPAWINSTVSSLAREVIVGSSLLLQCVWISRTKVKPSLIAYFFLITLIMLAPMLQPDGGPGIISQTGAIAFVLLNGGLLLRPGILFGRSGSKVSLPPQQEIPQPVINANRQVYEPENRPAPQLDNQQVNEKIAPPENQPADSDVSQPANPKILFDDVRLQEYIAQVSTHISLHQTFKTKGLTLADLAVELSLPQHQLSYILKNGFRQQYNEFINQYRVNYIKNILSNGGNWEKMKLEAIGSDAGFSSRSTFFAAFKKHTGQTPAEFVKQILKERA
jgi:AraC-like DNA-binding protein